MKTILSPFPNSETSKALASHKRAMRTAQRSIIVLCLLAVLSLGFTGISHYRISIANSAARLLQSYEVAWSKLLGKAYLLYDLDKLSLPPEDVADLIHASIIEEFDDILIQRETVNALCMTKLTEDIHAFFSKECGPSPDISQSALSFVAEIYFLPADQLVTHFETRRELLPRNIRTRIALSDLSIAQHKITEKIQLRERILRVMNVALSFLIFAISWIFWRFQISPSIAKMDSALHNISTRESFLRSTMGSIEDAVIICTPDGSVLTCNLSAEQLINLPHQKIVGQAFLDVLPLRNTAHKIVKDIPFKSDDTSSNISQYFTLEKAGDASFITLALRMSVIKNEHGDRIGDLLIFTDVTQEQRHREAQETAYRLQSLGQLSAGVSHDFNNLLASIRAAAELAALDQDLMERNNYLEAIISSVDRGAALTERLRRFAKPDSAPPKGPCVAWNSCNSAVKILRSTLPQNILIDLKPDQQQHLIACEETTLENVFVNLGLNSANAMPDGGVITVTVTEASGKDIGVPLDPNQHYVRIDWHDTGHGIDDETIKRVFDPFYTTRRTTGGTGLGLSIAASAIRSFDGHIICRSQVDEFTCFSVFLPKLDGRTVVSEPIKTPASMPFATNKTLLIVDDEVDLTTYMKKSLEQHGAQVYATNNGEDAIDLYRRHGADIDLVLLDQNMPGLRGSDVAIHLLDSHPDCKIAVLTGNTPEDTKKDFANIPVAEFFYKPISLDVLVREIDKIASLDHSLADS